MIRRIQGDLFKSKCQVIVNPVNCVGVMGKGLALEFKNRFPEMYEDYAHQCAIRKLKPGVLHLWKNSEPWILNFPTKDHWKYPSLIEYIEYGFEAFCNSYAEHCITSIAFPELGTGLGGLLRDNVREMMDLFLSPLPNIDVEIIEAER